jgi:hypothetical protein
MEPGPTERHESDTAAATTPAGGSDASGAVGGPLPAESPTRAGAVDRAQADGAERAGGVDSGRAGGPGNGVGSAATAGDGPPPRPRNRRGWMSDSPLDGGSGWPTSAYAIIRRPDNSLSANGSAPTSLPNHAAPIAPAPQPVPSEPVAQAPPAAKVKLPRQKSWLRGRGWSNRDTAPEQYPEMSATDATVNLQAAVDADQTEADIASEPVDEVATGARPAGLADAGAWTTDSLGITTRDSLGTVVGAAADLSAREDTADSGDTTALTHVTSHTADTSTADASLAPQSVDTSAAGEPADLHDDLETDDLVGEHTALNIEAAEETRDLRAAMLSLRRPDDGTSAARGTAVVTAGPLPDVDEEVPADDDQPAPAEETGTPRGLAIAAAIVIFVALALVVFFTIRANGTPDEETAPPTPTAGAVVQPGSSTPVSFAPQESAAGSPAAVVQGPQGAVDVLRAGSVRLAIGTNQADESFDFDSGIKGAPNAFTGGQQPDLDALTQGLWAANGAHVAVWSKPTPPTEADCRALRDSDWTSLVKLEPVLVGPKVCVQTSEGRAASFIARPIDVGPDGGVQTVYLDFTVWKKAGD